MKVAVDATAIPGQRLGVGVYLTELLRHVSGVDIHVFVRQAHAPELAGLLAGATIHPVAVDNRAARLAWSYSVLPVRVRRLRPDVFFGPHYTLPAGLRVPSVVTFHDPTFFTLPRLHERKKVAFFRRAARAGISRASRVIAVSEYARRGAIEHGGADPDRVDVVSEGIDPRRYRPVVDGPRSRRPFVAFVGALEPRKDVPSAIAAFDEAMELCGTSHEFLIAGPRAWGAAAVDRALADARHAASIRLLGFIPDDEKVTLLQRADCFVYPSIAEGFGVPVLEALACGAPVITTTGSAPEEIAGDAAVLVAPQDRAALRDALVSVLRDEALSAKLRAAGPARASSYTWETAAAATVDVWRRAAEGR